MFIFVVLERWSSGVRLEMEDLAVSVAFVHELIYPVAMGLVCLDRDPLNR